MRQGKDPTEESDRFSWEVAKTGNTLAMVAQEAFDTRKGDGKAKRFCRLDQVEGDVRTVPGEKMKALKGKATGFLVPLSGEWV